jgi:phage gp46-like protein
MSLDLAIVETGNGGDLQLNGNDLAIVTSLENQPYLAMFGGNLEASTDPNNIELISGDWWGNDLLFPNQPDLQMNSLTERVLNQVNLNSLGISLIENAIKQDLKFLQPQAQMTVSVQLISDDRLDVKIRMIVNNTSARLVVINFKKQTDGDFFILDFNDDFNV